MVRRPRCRICRAVLAMWPHVAGVCNVCWDAATLGERSGWLLLGWRVVMRSES